MAVKDNEKNKAYVAKHRELLRATLGNDGYKKREAEARALRRKKEKERKAQQAITLPPLKPLNIPDLFDTPKLQQLDINNLINALPPVPNHRRKRNEDANPNHRKKSLTI
jgi:hypothetical protein